MTGAAIMLVALGLDALVGWPRRLHALIGHPVVWIGWLIGAFDRWINLDGADEGARRLAGVVTALVITGIAAKTAWLATSLLPGGWSGVILAGVLAWPLVAMRSMREHVEAVAGPLAADDLGAARRAVAMIVGRDPPGSEAEWARLARALA